MYYNSDVGLFGRGWVRKGTSGVQHYVKERVMNPKLTSKFPIISKNLLGNLCFIQNYHILIFSFCLSEIFLKGNIFSLDI